MFRKEGTYCYRWNPFTHRWDVWINNQDYWTASKVYVGNEPIWDTFTTELFYEDTWAEPEDY